MKTVQLTRLNALPALMFLLLHIAIWNYQDIQLSRAMMLSHLGLFLIWQPIWKRDQHLDRASATLFIIFTLAFVTWLNQLFFFIWLLLLIGLIGGRIFVTQHDKYAYRIMMVFLITELLFGCATQLFEINVDKQLLPIIELALLVTPLLLIFLSRQKRRRVDFLHGLSVSLMSAALALGSVLVMYSTQVPYTTALLQTLLVIGLFLLLTVWLLNPHPGYSGMEHIWSRYVLNISTPFEDWLSELAAIAEQQQHADAFLLAALESFSQLSWVQGCCWKGEYLQGCHGDKTPHQIWIHTAQHDIQVFTQQPPGATLILHAKLLIRIIGFYYVAKHAQEQLATQAHLQAVHETGARITHDIKNLLQSLHTLSSVIQNAEPSQQEEVNGLLQRQLPALTQRLQGALDKLQNSSQDKHKILLDCDSWWEQLKLRHLSDSISFNKEGEINHKVPTESFDTIMENLIENALNKRVNENNISISVHLEYSEKTLKIKVCDTGSAIKNEIQQQLFKTTVTSKIGLGIGLYQAYRLAQESGYKLTLQKNIDGQVCFEIQSV